jgi:hypothetical protein
MLSVRLPSELEAQLEHHALSTGVTKNAIVTQALAQYMKTVDLADLPVKGPVMESFHEQAVQKQREQAEQYKSAHAIADQIRRNTIWTKSDEAAEDAGGKPTPGIYGRNVLVGFTDSFNGDGELYVISRYISGPPRYGTDAFHLYVTKHDHWKKYMKELDVL